MSEKKEIAAFKQGVRFALKIGKEGEEKDEDESKSKPFNPFEVCAKKGHKPIVLDVTPRYVKVNDVSDWREIVRLICARCFNAFNVALPKDEEITYNLPKKVSASTQMSKEEPKVFKIYEDKESGMYVVVLHDNEFWYSRFESAMDFIKEEMKKK